MTLNTNFNTPPYFDDFDPNKKYYRILFKPATAVQARELTQLQTNIQYQIEQLGNSLYYKNGTVIDGCAVNEIKYQPFVRIKNFYSNGATLTLSNISNTIVESANTGLRANILKYVAGNETSYPATNILYVSYLNTGNNGATAFGSNELLNFYLPPRSNNYLISSAYTYNNTVPSTLTTGFTTVVTIGQGTIYQKGFFTKTDFQIVPVVTPNTDFITLPNNQSVGFTTSENIVTSASDTSLLDNAQGYYNYNAPGADRLQLTGTAISLDREVAANTENFFSLVEYANDTINVINQEPQLSKALKQKFATYSNETNGNFILKPFTVTPLTHASNSNLFIAQVSPGRGYVQGQPVQTLANINIPVRRGLDTANISNAITQTSYGNYILVKEYLGNLDFSVFDTVKIYDLAQRAITNRVFPVSISPSGNLIGTANIRSVELESGTPSTPDCVYRVYLFNIKMNSGYSFNSSAKSLVFGNNAGYADIILDVGSANNVSVYGTNIDTSLANFGVRALKTIRVLGSNNASYIARIAQVSTTGLDGTISLTLPQKGTTNNQPYSTDPGDYIVVMSGGAFVGNNSTGTSSGPGTVQVFTANTLVNGSGTTFTRMFSPGEYLVANGTNDVRRVISVANNTALTVDSPFSAQSNTSGYTKYYPPGYIVPLTSGLATTRSITTSPGPTPTISINIGANTGLGGGANQLNASTPVTVYYNIRRTNAVQATKNLYKDLYVRLNIANNAGGVAGPWCLGIPDVEQITGVWANSVSYSNTGTNLNDFFVFNTNKNSQDNIYELSYMTATPGNFLGINNPYVTVRFNAYIPDMIAGVGFYSVDSYTANSTNLNQTAPIQYQDIPVYVNSVGNTVPLRDVIDYRPFKTATAAISNNVSGSTLNPSANSTTFNVDSTGGTYAYYPSATEFFSTDLSYYLGRKDLIYFNTTNYPSILEGTPSSDPLASPFPVDSLPVAVLNVEPYPSLTVTEYNSLTSINNKNVSVIRDTTYLNSVDLISSKRYTMNDIGLLDNRISKLEYYVSLSLLEQSASSLQIIDPLTGLNRYKNGIFVEAFNTFGLSSDTSNPQWAASIDLINNVCRPLQFSEDVDLKPVTFSDTVQTDTGITLNYTSKLYDICSQTNSNYYRNLGNVNYTWDNGKVELYPNYSNLIDVLVPPNILNNSSDKSNYLNAAKPLRNVLFENNQDVDYNVLNQKYTTINPTASGKLYQNGYWDIKYTSAQYIKPREIGFKATNIRPGANVKLYINYNDASSYTAPGIPNTAITDTSNSAIIYRTDSYGTQLKVSAGGSGANLIPTIVSGQVTAITIVNGGFNYVNNSLLTFNTLVPGNGAAGYIRTNGTGTIISANLTSRGSNYDSTNPPSVGATGAILYGKVSLPATTFSQGTLTFLITDGTANSVSGTLVNETTRASGTFVAEEYFVTESYNPPAPVRENYGGRDRDSSGPSGGGGGNGGNGPSVSFTGSGSSSSERTYQGGPLAGAPVSAGFGYSGIGTDRSVSVSSGFSYEGGRGWR
jgi:hypothetical protein